MLALAASVDRNGGSGGPALFPALTRLLAPFLPSPVVLASTGTMPWMAWNGRGMRTISSKLTAGQPRRGRAGQEEANAG